MKLSLYSVALAGMLIFVSLACRKGENTIDELQKDAVNEIIRGGDVISAPKASYEETPNGYSDQSTSDNKDFLCNGKRIKETVVLDKLTLNAFDDRSVISLKILSQHLHFPTSSL